MDFNLSEFIFESSQHIAISRGERMSSWMELHHARDMDWNIHGDFLQLKWKSMAQQRGLITWSYRNHDDVIKWKHFPCYWPSVRGIHRFPVNSQHKGQWRGALMSYLICVWINGWVNSREAGDLRRHRAHCDVIVMMQRCGWSCNAKSTIFSAIYCCIKNDTIQYNLHRR